MVLATRAEIDEFLSKNDRWSLEKDELVATATLADFVEAMGLVNRIALLAEKANHHPDIAISWNKVTLRLSTHSEGGITARDLDLAARLPLT
ncbi:MAG TPA: 4a-hydroxytetrahydrobiopterin dehydratase [Acidimicrobiia bacterium]|nr:4a-hydroxytetrahydrobiopterin dehydratase [Acidimicrobiia bacterium]